MADHRLLSLTREVARSGLTDVQVASLRQRHGANTVPEVARPAVLRRAGRQLRDPMLLLLLAASALTTWQGDLSDTAVILTVVVLNTAVGVVQEVRAEHAVAALRSMAAPHARVRRNGADNVVPVGDVVPGDLMLLEAGDIVAADAEVIESQQLKTDDAALTGESLPVSKAPGDDIFAGTTVVRGRGMATVTRTGADSSLGRIASLVAAARPGPTPLQERLTRLARTLTAAAVGISCLVIVEGLLRGLPLANLVVSATSLAVAAVPESLPAVLTLSLALGARRMAGRAAIARELRSVETLGSVTLLATDKTGTLTENRMVAERVWTPAGEFDVSGGGYGPIGIVSPRGVASAAALRRLLIAAVLCNDADVQPDPDHPGTWRPVGDPTEAALVALAHRGGVNPAAERAAAPRHGEVPFDSDRAWMATAHGTAGDDPVVYKGAPDVLLASVTGPAAEAARSWAVGRAADGARVLALAEGRHGLVGTTLPTGLTLLGLVALADPPRQDVAPVLALLEGAGIRVAVMTGDHPATAEAIARRVGLLHDSGTDLVRTGRDLDDGIDSASLGAVLFARVRPEHKLALVRAWQEAGEVVAVTGDGVNDGPALRRADIGVAMGQGGTEVARQAADLVLTDDSLQTIVHAVEEGRRIHDNLRRYLRYALGGGLAEVLVMLLMPFVGFLVPLLPGQILWINMLTHGLPGVALGADPGSPEAMTQRPVPRTAALVDRTMARQIIVTGTLVGGVSMVAALWARADGMPWRTSSFLVLGLGQLGVAVAVRAPGAARHNPFFALAVASAMVLQTLAVLVPPLRELLGTAFLPPQMWWRCALLAVIPGLALRMARRAGRRVRVSRRGDARCRSVDRPSDEGRPCGSGDR